jgi:hypothetical protein
MYIRLRLLLSTVLFIMVIFALVNVSFLTMQDAPTPVPTPIGDDHPITGLVTVDSALIYVGPDFAYSIIGELPRNTSVIVTGRAGDFYQRWDGRQWLQFDYGERKAWVYARLLRTSKPFNSIPPSGGRILPRNRDGRVPEGFDLTQLICDTWPDGPYTRSGEFLNGDTELIVTYPTMPGANVYSVITLSPSGLRTAFDSIDGTATIKLDFLPREKGTYTWRVAPYWTERPQRYYWQQLCLSRTGGTFERP